MRLWLDIRRTCNCSSEHAIFPSVYNGFVGKPEGKRPLGRPGNRWEDNITIYFQDTEWGCGLD
jgi:hypothetical protein